LSLFTVVWIAMLEINIPEVVAEVTAAFTRYERALIANDVAELDSLFWDSSLTLRFGINENLYGHGAIAGFRSGRPAMDLTRDLMKTVAAILGRRIPNFNALAERFPAGRAMSGCAPMTVGASRRSM
jgi:hypothetical protein